MVVSMLGVFGAVKKYDNNNSLFPFIHTFCAPYAPNTSKIMFVIYLGHKLA